MRISLATTVVKDDCLRRMRDGPVAKAVRELVGAIGLEPTTPTMSRWCSNQLSYAPTEPAEESAILSQHSADSGRQQLARERQQVAFLVVEEDAVHADAARHGYVPLV